MRKVNRNKRNVMKISITNSYGIPVYENTGTFIDKTEKRRGERYSDISGDMKVTIVDSTGNEIYASKDRKKKKKNYYDNKKWDKRKEKELAHSIEKNAKKAEEQKKNKEIEAAKQAEEFFNKKQQEEKQEKANAVHQEALEKVKDIINENMYIKEETKEKKHKKRKYIPYAEMKRLQKAKKDLNIGTTSSNSLPDDVKDLIKAATGNEPPKPKQDDDSKYEQMAADYGFDEDDGGGYYKTRKTNKGGEY